MIGRHYGHQVVSVSIVGRDQSLGRASFADRGALMTREHVEAIVTVGLAGRAADERFIGAALTGAHDDLFSATGLLTAVHRSYGLGSTLSVRGPVDDFQTALWSDPELARLVEADLQRLMARARELVERYEPAIRALAKTLLTERAVTGAEVDAAIAGAISAGFDRGAR